MFDHDTNTDETVSRRSVLKTAGGVLAGSTALAGLGSGTAAADEERVQVELRELNEEYVAVEVYFPDDLFDGVEFPDDLFDEVEFPDDLFLGHAESFVVHGDEEAVSLPEETEGLATPVEMDFGNPHEATVYFRTRDVDPRPTVLDDDEVVLGLGLFPERTVPIRYWNTCPGHRVY
jgi:hypothetical protein